MKMIKKRDVILSFVEMMNARKWDGKQRVDAFIDLIEFDTDDPEKANFWRSCIRKMLYFLVAVHFQYRTDESERLIDDKPCPEMLLVIQCSQDIGITNFLHSILPYSLRHLSSRVDSISFFHYFMLRDREDILSGSKIVEFCDIEHVFEADQKLLRELSERDQIIYRDIYDYDFDARNNIKKSLCVCTTRSMKKLVLNERAGNKVIIMQVKSIDNEGLEDSVFNRQQIFAEIMHDITCYRSDNPNNKIQDVYSLSPKEKQYNNMLNSKA